MINLNTIKPNFNMIQINDTIFYFSYKTIIAMSDHNGLKVSKNEWSNTTGRHLNYIDTDKSTRIDHDQLMNYVNSNY